MEFNEVVKKRQSVREFHSKKPNWRDVVEAIDAARQAPAAGNLHCVKFIFIDDKKVIDKLQGASQQDFIADAKFVVVACSDPTGVVRSFDERGEVYARQQVGAAIENFLLSITNKGLATCWVGAFVDDQVRTILSIPANVNVDAILPVGYAKYKKMKKRKPNFDKFLFFNKWGNQHLKKWKAIEAF